MYVKFRIDIQTIRLILARERIKYENETLNISRGWEIVVCSLSTPLPFSPNKSLASSLIILTNAIEQSCQLIWGGEKSILLLDFKTIFYKDRAACIWSYILMKI